MPVPNDVEEQIDTPEDGEDGGNEKEEEDYDENVPLKYFNLMEFRRSVSKVSIQSKIFANFVNSRILGMMTALSTAL